mgnify:CR=1 FL=1
MSQRQLGRCGVIAKKLGMSRLLQSDGSALPVTVLQLDNCQVVAQRTMETDGYTALQVGAGKAKVSRTSKPMRGHYGKAKVEPKRKLVEFRIMDDALLEVGAEFEADHFVAGQKVDVTGLSIGKGFAGGMKRHNFGGTRATHGVSVSHRALGSTGGCQDPGKVFKGKKMAGQLGNERVTVQNLTVAEVDNEDGLILIKGAVPGHNGSWLLLKDAVKAALPEEAPYPGKVREAEAEAVAPEGVQSEGAGPDSDEPGDTAAVDSGSEEEKG